MIVLCYKEAKVTIFGMTLFTSLCPLSDQRYTVFDNPASTSVHEKQKEPTSIPYAGSMKGVFRKM